MPLQANHIRYGGLQAHANTCEVISVGQTTAELCVKMSRRAPGAFRANHEVLDKRHTSATLD